MVLGGGRWLSGLVAGWMTEVGWQLSDWATDWVVIAAGWMASCCVTGLLDMRWQVGYGRVP